MHLNISRPFKLDDEASHPLKLLSKQLLILPAFIVIVLMAIVFLSISWPLRAGQLFLLKVK